MFCLQDGTPLVEAGFLSEETLTLGEMETVVSHKISDQQFRDTSPQNWQTNQTGQAASPQVAPASKQSFPIILALLLFFLVICVAGVGLLIYLQKGSPLDNSNLLLANASNTNAIKSDSKPVSATPNQSETNKNKKADVKTTSIDEEEIKAEVSERLENWKSDAEMLDLDSYMSNYAETVDYYNKNSADWDFVRRDKEKAFKKYDSIEITLSNLKITPDESGQSAIVILDKEWNFSNIEGETNSGKVRQQITLKKFGNKWLITGEKDLQVYYINK
jgi:hypothetical protein